MTPLQKLKKSVQTSLDSLDQQNPIHYGIIKTLETVGMWIDHKLIEEEQMVKDAMHYALDEDGHTGDWKHKFVNTYYESISQTQEATAKKSSQ